AEIVDDGERRQEHLEGHMQSRTGEGQDSEREGDVGGSGDGPAPQRLGAAGVDRDVDERRRDHSSERRNAWQDALRPTRKLALNDLALDLEADEQEEEG